MSAAAPPPDPEQAATLQARVEAVTHELGSLAALLAREGDALARRAGAATLEQIAADKQAAIERVGHLHAGLRQRLEQAGVTPGGGIDVLAQLEPKLAASLGRMAQLIGQCQRANQDNGVLVNAGLRNARGGLETLRALGATAQRADTYDREAETSRARAGDRLTLTA